MYDLLKIGFALTEITPSLPCELGGYALRSRQAEKVHSSLYCRCMVGEENGALFAIVSLDLLGFDLQLRDEVYLKLQQVISIEDNRISFLASHTHSSIDGVPSCLHKGLWTKDQKHLPLSYRQQLMESIVSGLIAADSVKKEVQLRWFKTASTGIASNRRDVNKAVDQEAHLLKVYDAQTSEVIGGLLHYACHPTVLGPEDSIVSADFPGAALAGLEKQFPNSIFLYANGAAGDISTRCTRQGSDPAEAERMGNLLYSSLEQMEEIAVEAEACYHSEITELEFIDRLNGAAIQTLLQKVKLAGMILWMIPGEIFSSFALEMKELNSRSLMIGFANDYIGYLPDEEAWGNGGYEVDVSRLGSDDIQKLKRNWL